MRLSIWGFAVTCAIFMAAVVFIVGIINIYVDGYGWMILQMASSIYPGYAAKAAYGSVLVGTAYALVDGAVAGLIFAWLYNILTVKRRRAV